MKAGTGTLKGKLEIALGSPDLPRPMGDLPWRSSPGQVFLTPTTAYPLPPAVLESIRPYYRSKIKK
jgi:hypothetical protein